MLPTPPTSPYDTLDLSLLRGDIMRAIMVLLGFAVLIGIFYLAGCGSDQPLPPLSGEKSVKKLLTDAQEAPKTFTNSVGMEFVLIPAGEFMMGSLASEKGHDSDETQHKVKITKPFYLQTTEVTQAQWKAVMGNLSRFKGDNLPVEKVSWDDAQEFTRKLSAKDGVRYRLPTEAEWEYACRAGSTGMFCFGDDDGKLDQYAWYGYDKCGKKTHPVGQKKPNAWGLYDMHGNVWEWCEDWYDKDYYGKSLASDPQGPSRGEYRVLRGGSWLDNAGYCRSANRGWDWPTDRDHNTGVRVSRSSQ
jgi:formylglycine-generating enzyme required for sulfatase activity